MLETILVMELLIMIVITVIASDEEEEGNKEIQRKTGMSKTPHLSLPSTMQHAQPEDPISC